MIFVSYSHADELWRKRLLRIAKPLMRYQDIKFWSDRDIDPGSGWRSEITKAMDLATIAVLLVSDNFLDSDFIADVELPYFLKEADRRDVSVLWVLVTPCLWKKSQLKIKQAFYMNELKPLVGMTEIEWMETLCGLCERIDTLAQKAETPIINSSLNGRSFPRVNSKLQVLAAPAKRETEVLVYAGDRCWYRQAPITIGAKVTKCNFGSENTKVGSKFSLVALTTDKPLERGGVYEKLPDHRTKSQVITVKRG